MKDIKKALILAAVLCALSVPAAAAKKAGDRGKIVSSSGDGGVCYELDVKEAAAYIRKAEAAEKAGKLKQAFDAATGGVPACMAEEDGDDRLFGIVERTYKKLGQEAEKAGRLEEAHKYFITPFDRYFAPGMYREREKYYSFADADRTMLKIARAGQNDYDVVYRAVWYSEAHDGKPNLKEVYGIAARGGERLLAKEDKAFAAGKYKEAVDLLEESLRWFRMTQDERPVYARARKRADSLIAIASADSIERALEYCNVSLLDKGYLKKQDEARSLARRLGEEAEKKGDYALAGRYYYLAGDEARSDAMGRNIEDIAEKKEKKQAEAEGKRQGQFKKGQSDLEKELGF